MVTVRAKIKIQGNVCISHNHANDNESVFLIRDSSSVSFSGNIVFTNNTGRQGELYLHTVKSSLLKED
jgi:hypothetical protein